jgi:hypothetical protein
VWRGTATPFQSVPPLLCRARRAGQAFWRRRVTQSCHLPLVICHWSLEHFNFGCLRGGSPDPPRMPRFLSQEPPFRARWVRRPTAQRLSGVVAVDRQEVQKKVAAKKRGGPSAGGLQGDPQFETGRLYYSVCSADCQEEWLGFFENITGSVGKGVFAKNPLFSGRITWQEWGGLRAMIRCAQQNWRSLQKVKLAARAAVDYDGAALRSGREVISCVHH